jgi:hypothetical protein
MNTGADDDSRSTPTVAFCNSSARAIPLASSPANASRVNPLIQFPPLRISIEIIPEHLCPG